MLSVVYCYGSGQRWQGRCDRKTDEMTNPPYLLQIASHVHSHTQILGCRNLLWAEMPRPFIFPSFLGHLSSKSPLLKWEPGGESVCLHLGLSAGFQCLLPFSLHSNFRGTETNEPHKFPPQTLLPGIAPARGWIQTEGALRTESRGQRLGCLLGEWWWKRNSGHMEWHWVLGDPHHDHIFNSEEQEAEKWWDALRRRRWAESNFQAQLRLSAIKHNGRVEKCFSFFFADCKALLAASSWP